jgi:hypothetical protein
VASQLPKKARKKFSVFLGGVCLMTFRQLKKVIRQLHFHRRRIEWMRKKIAENEWLIRKELMERELKELAIGGFKVKLQGEEVTIEELPPIDFDQLELLLNEAI